MELLDLPKIGPTTLKKLNSLSIYTVDDLVRNYPYKFNVLSLKNIDDEKSYNDMVIEVIIESSPIVRYFGKLNSLSFRGLVQDKIINIVIFNRNFIKQNIIPGNIITVIGKYDPLKSTLTASDILFRKINGKYEIIPVYHLCKGISSNQMNTYINSALSNIEISNNIPSVLKDKYSLMNEKDALEIIHNPVEIDSFKKAFKTLKYEEIYTYMYKLKKIKEKNDIHDNKFIKNVNDNLVNKFIDELPFELTLDQKKVIDEMLNDIKSDKSMNRLLQGDVGSGKTIVAVILAYAVYTAGFKTLFMAPTEVLAKQHYESISKLLKKYNVKVELLTGKMKTKEKNMIYNKLSNDEIDILIGTHALISDNVTINNLGLIITDEQHRFGVNQRLALKNKSNVLDTLMMSATPIPRTYALTLYGDTDISSIKTKPKGRKDVITKVKTSKDLKEVLTSLYKDLKNNNQIYVIAPMIDENEDVNYENVNDLKHKFKLAFPNYNIEVMHGKLNDIEKEKIMDDFVQNKINILISTTVIEVGIDVPNATSIVIFDADRFGLSTLHQLRGRVGRNDIQSYCYLISDKNSKRLKIMEQTNDGYKISEADFKLRGQGDIFGNRQSGALDFKLSDIKKDYELFLKVKEDVNLLN